MVNYGTRHTQGKHINKVTKFVDDSTRDDDKTVVRVTRQTKRSRKKHSVPSMGRHLNR